MVRGQPGSPDVAFDYLVYGLRIGFEEQSIVQTKAEDAPIPSMENHRRLLAAHPDLRAYTAMARFEAMRGALGMREPLNLSASQELRAAVGEAPWSEPPVIDAQPEAREPIEEQDRMRATGR